VMSRMPNCNLVFLGDILQLILRLPLVNTNQSVLLSTDLSTYNSISLIVKG